MSPSQRLSVLLIDSSTELLGVIEEFLTALRFIVTATSLVRLLDRPDPVAWIRDVNPDVVVFELSVPYEATWAFCDTLRSDARVRSPFVVTTLNRSAVERLTPARGAIEIISVPTDLPRVEEAILAAAGLREEPTRNAERRLSQRRIGDRRHAERRQGDRGVATDLPRAFAARGPGDAEDGQGTAD